MKLSWRLFVVCIIGLGIISGSKIYAQMQEPILSYACETKSGVLMGVGDGWSAKSDCKGDGQRVVRLGNLGPNGTGNILFIYKLPGDPIYILTTDGKIYRQFNNNGWEIVSPTDPYYPNALPPEVPSSSVAQWMVMHFLDTDGNVWWYNRQGRSWINIGHP